VHLITKWGHLSPLFLQLFIFFLAMLLSVDCFAQRINVSGRVEDETGQGVPFTLNVSAIGYRTWQQTFAIQPPDSLVAHIALVAQSVGLEGVVVQGATGRIYACSRTLLAFHVCRD
jgi:hypothetical protein